MSANLNAFRKGAREVISPPTSPAAWAARYVGRLGLALTPLRGKAPIREGWNLDENLLRTPDAAREYFSRNPRDNMGACLEASGLVSLDADYPEGARQVLAAEGIDLDVLIASTPTIIGRSPRLEFNAPENPLGRKSVVWPPKVEGEKPVTVLELRAGRVQDVLPPSNHPDTKQPYRWLTPPRHGFPPLPQSLLTLWQNFDAFRLRARNLCPWAEPEATPAPPPPRQHRQRTGPSVIAAFNEAHDPIAILESHGYQRIAKRRWKSPNGHGLGGVVVLPSGKVYCHHQSDELGDGRAHDAFDLYVRLEHRGDVRAAVRTAARALRLDQGVQHGRR